MTRTRAAGVFTVLTLTAAALSACGATESPRRPPASRAAAPGTAPGKAGASPGPQAPIAPAGVISRREGRIDDEPVTVELTQLRRRGRVVNLELKLRTRAADVELDIGDAFDDGVAQNLSDPAAVPDFEFKDSMDGINIIDGVNGRRFAPARDRFNHCICDRDLGSVTLSRSRPLTLSATFGAPPPDVRAVDVVISRFGTIPDVQLG